MQNIMDNTKKMIKILFYDNIDKKNKFWKIKNELR